MRTRLLAAGCLIAAVTMALPALGAPSAPRTGVSKLSATSSGGQVSLQGWATFSGAVIGTGTDSASDAAAGGAASGGELIGADLVYRPELADFFIRLKLTAIPSVGPIVGDPTLLYGLRTVVAGVPIDIRAQSTGAGAQFALFNCKSENGCTNVATLNGGLGTTGEEVVVDLPFATLVAAGLHIKEGDKIGTPIAYTARAPFAAGSLTGQQEVDGIVLSKAASVVVPTKSVRVTVGKVTQVAALKDGYFTASFPASAFGGKSTATAKTQTCLGSDCVVQTFSVSR